MYAVKRLAPCAALLAVASSLIGVELPVDYTRLEYVTIPISAQVGNCVVMPNVQWKNIGRITGTFRCSSAASATHMLFSSTSNGGASKSAPYIALNGGQTVRVSSVTVSPAWTDGDDYAMDGVTPHKVDFAISGCTSANALVFGGCWSDTGWSREVSWSEIAVMNASNVELAHLYACTNSSGVAGFYDVVGNAFHERYNSSFAAFTAGPVYVPPTYHVTLSGQDGALVSLNGSAMAATASGTFVEDSVVAIAMQVPGNAETTAWIGTGAEWVGNLLAAETTLTVRGEISLTTRFVAYPVGESEPSPAMAIETRVKEAAVSAKKWFSTYPGGGAALLR